MMRKVKDLTCIGGFEFKLEAEEKFKLPTLKSEAQLVIEHLPSPTIDIAAWKDLVDILYAKTKTVKFTNYLTYFWRFYFDGDSTIGVFKLHCLEPDPSIDELNLKRLSHTVTKEYQALADRLIFFLAYHSLTNSSVVQKVKLDHSRSCT